MNLRFDKRDINGIVHIECGSSHGSAFFVGKATLLTARHVVVSVLDKENEYVTVCVFGNRLKATAHSECAGGVNADVARLELTEPISDVAPLNLLSVEFEGHPELLAVGFPSGAGIGEMPSWYEVTYEHALNNHPFSTHTSNISEVYSVQSLKGISGGPILNQSGSVVGIATYQQGRALGFLSISRYVELRKADSVIPCSHDADREDYSTYGLGTSVEQTKRAIKTVGNRYKPKDNIENRNLLATLKAFVDYKGASDTESRIAQREKDVESLFKYGSIEVKNNIDGTPDYIETFDEGDKEQIGSISLTSGGDTLQTCISDLKLLYDKRENYAFGLMVLTGKAGTGKTHTLCDFLENHAGDVNRYLLLGSNFVTSESVTTQICDKLGFAEDGLALLNQKMVEKGRSALIVIDALNEGANEGYWKSAVVELSSVLAEYHNVKLIVSVREPYDKSIFDGGTEGWKTVSIKGFQEVDGAIKKYFRDAHIPFDVSQPYRQELKNPLFLNIFCQTYNQLTSKEQEHLNKITLFEAYLKVRNGKVCELSDEDPYNNITLKMAQKLCHYSLYYNECNMVPRVKARSIGNRIIRREGWQKSLLHSMIAEGLLLENLSDDLKTELVQIEYEKMGDYLKAKELLSSKMNAEQIVEFVADMYRRINKPTYNGNKTKFKNMLAALFAMWGDEHRCASVNLLEQETLKPVVEDYSAALKDESGKYQEKLLDIYYEQAQPIDASSYWEDRKYRPLTDYEELHKKLLVMSQPDRDLMWAEPVNELFDRIQDYFTILNPYMDEENGIQKMLILLGWFLASSYPKGRCIVTRELYQLVIYDNANAERLLNLFMGCNEPYVLQGVLAAVYGGCIVLHDKDFSAKMADIVIKGLIDVKLPMLDNLQVRQWALKILENADYECKSDKYFQKLKFPLSDTDSPLKLLDGEFVRPDEEFYGKSRGSYKLWNSLYGFSDFNRYVIGTNSRSESNVFFLKDADGSYKGIPNDKLLKALTEIISSEWNDHLGHLDDDRYSENRYDNKKERIGKKYQWMAWHNLEGRLLDYAKVARWDEFVHNPKEDDFVKRPMPWHTGSDSRLDPTLVETTGLVKTELFDHIEEQEGAVEMSAVQWLNDTSIMPQLQFLYKDKNNKEWALVQGYDSRTIKTTDAPVQEFVFYNTGFVPNDKVVSFREWTSKQNFYGRWMPEHRNGDNTTLWNEFPWTECYKEQGRDKWEEVNDQQYCPSKIRLPYETLLQEHHMGLSEESYSHGEVLAPCADMMNFLKLRTSKVRGLVEDSEKKVVAMNMCPFVRAAHNGLLIRRDVLNAYLKARGYTMFYFILGEKTYKSYNDSMVPLNLSNTDLSGAAQYPLEGDIEIIQPLCNVGTLEKDIQ